METAGETFARAVAILRSKGRRVLGRITMGRDDFAPWPNWKHEYEALLEHEGRGDVMLGSVDAAA